MYEQGYSGLLYWVAPLAENLPKQSSRDLKKGFEELMDKRVSYSAIGRILGVHRLTVSNFVNGDQLVARN